MSDNREILRTTSLKGMTPARVGNQEAVDTYQATIGEVQARCGVEVASLFAEPVRPSKPDASNPQMTWFTQLDGQMLDLATIDEVARRPVTMLLSRRLEQLQPILDDPQFGPIVASWLNITSTADILSVGGNPVLINWGYLPESVARSGIGREAHFTETIGRYVPSLQRPPFTAEESAAASDRLRDRPTSLKAAPVAATAAPPVQVSAPPPPERSRRFPGWLWTPLIATAIAAAILAVLLIPGVLIWPANDAERAARQRETDDRENSALEERLRTLENRAQQRVCHTPDGQPPRLSPLQTTPPGQPVPPAQTPPPNTPPGGRAQAPSPDNAAANLKALLDSNSVLVIGSTDEGQSKVGSGFFVTNDRIVTSRRVVMSLSPNSIQVTNKALGQSISARVLALSAPANTPDSPDISDLALLSVSAPPRTALSIGPAPAASTNIVSVGFPQSAMRSDPDFQAFVDGNSRAAPSDAQRNGSIVGRADQGPVKFVIHSAAVEVGSSGGPVVDLCGRVVGVNTVVRSDPPATQAKALDVSELRAFLQHNGVTPNIDEAQKPCPPAAAAPGPMAAPAPPGRK